MDVAGAVCITQLRWMPVFWEVVGHVAPPFDFPKFFRLVVAC